MTSSGARRRRWRRSPTPAGVVRRFSAPVQGRAAPPGRGRFRSPPRRRRAAVPARPDAVLEAQQPLGQQAACLRPIRNMGTSLRDGGPEVLQEPGARQGNHRTPGCRAPQTGAWRPGTTSSRRSVSWRYAERLRASTSWSRRRRSAASARQRVQRISARSGRPPRLTMARISFGPAAATSAAAAPVLAPKKPRGSPRRSDNGARPRSPPGRAGRRGVGYQKHWRGQLPLVPSEDRTTASRDRAL